MLAECPRASGGEMTMLRESIMALSQRTNPGHGSGETAALEDRQLARRAEPRDVHAQPQPLVGGEAGRDRLSDNARNRRLLETRLGERCRWMSFEAEHFLLAEPCRDQVIDALVDWAKHRSMSS